MTDARAFNAWRRLGYRLVPGEGFSYFLHLRPAEWPIMSAHTALGFLLAVLSGPSPAPAHLLAFSLTLLVVGQELAFTLPPGYTVAYAVCFAMSLAYSVPPLRFKAVAGVDWVIDRKSVV